MRTKDKFTLNNGKYGNHDAVLVSFEIVSGEILRCTKEYTLAYIPELGEWRGDVIAYGQWVDLDPEEIAELRMAYRLDELIRSL